MATKYSKVAGFEDKAGKFYSKLHVS